MNVLSKQGVNRAMLWICDILDPYLWLTDPDPDPALLVSDLQEANKIVADPALFVSDLQDADKK